MNRVSLGWIGMIAAAFIMIALIVIYIKKPSADRRARRIRRAAFVAPLAVFAFCAFIALGEHGGMGLVKELIEDPTIDKISVPVTTAKDNKNGVIEITVSGRTININGAVTEDPEEFRGYLAGSVDADRIELKNEFAVSSAMHAVTDILEEEFGIENIEWDSECIQATIELGQ